MDWIGSDYPFGGWILDPKTVKSLLLLLYFAFGTAWKLGSSCLSLASYQPGEGAATTSAIPITVAQRQDRAQCTPHQKK